MTASVGRVFLKVTAFTFIAYVCSENTSMAYWTQQQNLATLLDFDEPPHVTASIPVNFIFVGFGGEANDLDIEESTLRRWFGHLTDALPHSIVSSSTDFTTSHKVLSTHLEYRYEYNIVKADPKVTQVLESTVGGSLRPEDPAPMYEQAPKQMDFAVEAWRVSDALESLSEYLGLNRSYTIYVMNPRRTHTPNHLTQSM